MAKIRKTNIYPIKPIPSREDYFPGTDTEDNNKTKSFTVGSIIDATLLEAGFPSESTRLVSVGDIVIEGLEVTLTDVVWQILGTEHTVESSVLALTYPEEGFYRTDIIYGNSDGNLTLLEGEPSEDTALQPLTPQGGILVGIINLFGDTAVPAVPPVTDYKLKSTEAWTKFAGVGDLPNVSWADKNGLRWQSAGTDTTLHSMDITAYMQYRYDGRMLYICNDTTAENTLTIKHLSGTATGNTKFFMPEGEDIILEKGHIAAFRFYASSATAGRLELVALSKGGSLSITGYGVDLTDPESPHIRTVPVINVKDYGATGDGSTDDTAAIQAAFAYAKANDFKKVYFPEGVYMISKTLYLSSNIEYFGDGMDLSIIRNHASADAGLDLIVNIVVAGTDEMNDITFKTMIATEGADVDSDKNTVTGIKVHNLGIDWNDISCGSYSITSLMFSRAVNCHAYNIKLFDALPGNFSGTTAKNIGSCMLFAFTEDCSLHHSWIGSADYESVSVWFISKRTRIYNNVFEANKPLTYTNQTHCIQAARPSTAVDALLAEYGETIPVDTFVENNTFIMWRNTGHVVTSHSSDGFYVNDNHILFKDTFEYPIFVFKPFSGTTNFTLNNNVIDSREYDAMKYGSTFMALGTGGNSVPSSSAGLENGQIKNNTLLLSNSTITTDPQWDATPLIGSYITFCKNIEVSGNVVEIDGYDNFGMTIIGATGEGINIRNNIIKLSNPLEAVNTSGLILFRTAGGSKINFNGNIVYGTGLSRGVVIDSYYPLADLFIGEDNQFETVGERITDNSASHDITFGVTSVFNAKADKNGNITPPTSQLVKIDVTAGTTITTVTTEEILYSYAIPANTLSNGKIFIEEVISKMGSNGALTIKMYHNTSGVVAGGTQIGTYVTGSSGRRIPFSRTFRLRNSFLSGMWGNTASVTDAYATSSDFSIAFNPAVTNYIIFTAQLAVGTDSATHETFELTFKKATA